MPSILNFSARMFWYELFVSSLNGLIDALAHHLYYIVTTAKPLVLEPFTHHAEEQLLNGLNESTQPLQLSLSPKYRAQFHMVDAAAP